MFVPSAVVIERDVHAALLYGVNPGARDPNVVLGWGPFEVSDEFAAERRVERAVDLLDEARHARASGV